MRCIRDRGRFAEHDYIDTGRKLYCSRCNWEMEPFRYVLIKLWVPRLREVIFQKMNLFGTPKSRVS